MEVILKEDVVNLGYKDDIVNVKKGYARNYLIPQGKAILATPEKKKMLAETLKQRAFKAEKIRKEAEFLANLDIQEMWGIGPKTAERLRSRGFKKIGDIAEADLKELSIYFGKNAESMRNRALGIDFSEVHTEHEVKSISNEITFSQDSDDIHFLTQTLMRLSDKVGYRLRKANQAGRVIHIKIRYSDFTTFTRQKNLSNHTNIDDEIYQNATELLKKHLTPGRAVRLLGVGVSKLETPFQQLDLFNEGSQKRHELEQALDQLKEKFGDDIVVRANELKHTKD